MSGIDMTAFVEAVRKTFGGMLSLDVTPTEVTREKGIASGYDVSGIVGISGLGDPEGNPDGHYGSVILSFPEEVARRVVGQMLGVESVPTVDQDVADGIGELVNIVVGAAKRGLEKQGIDGCATSLPTVILGAQHRVFRQRDVECLRATFESKIGGFLLQVFSKPGQENGGDV